MRFYIGDGWTKEELDLCCERGHVTCFHPNDQFPYFTLDHRISSYFDALKLRELVSEVIPPFFFTEREKSMSWEQIIERYNR
jgi:hypothetical protein